MRSCYGVAGSSSLQRQDSVLIVSSRGEAFDLLEKLIGLHCVRTYRQHAQAYQRSAQWLYRTHVGTDETRTTKKGDSRNLFSRPIRYNTRHNTKSRFVLVLVAPEKRPHPNEIND